MERVDLVFKSILLFFGGLFSILADNFGLLFAILIVVQIVDFITGTIASIKEGKGLRSSIGITGFSKKVVTLLIIGVFYLIEINLFGSNISGDAVAAVYVGLELLSITENAGRMGVYIHPKITQMITILKGDDKTEGLNDD
ncbi:phage holin family protein [Halalkalibacterium halodurans]|uniref:phage holin family protein n=1 Tax=Halalkalibacterium halodurans TaxID=86665 RepID=UPI002AAA5A82|nr:phage holin family protein [Halalkalibacterium halodurans]MDY7224669.1 phage holin family protein [Halalkalibacterium halodurans]MDY7243224.1 phage holin family protein [Halalkalibacterium halodurans]